MRLTVLTVLALVFALKFAQAAVIPIVLALLISYALEPVVKRLAAYGPRPVAAALVLGLIAGSAGVLLYQLRYQAEAVIQQVPEAARRLRQTLEREKQEEPSALEKVQKAATEIERTAAAATSTPPAPSGVTRVQVETQPTRVADYLLWGSMGLAAVAGQLALVLLLTYFLLSAGDLFRRKLVKMAGPSLARKRVTLQILEDISRQIESFLVVQVVSSVTVGVVSWLVFRALGLEQAGVWGLFAGVFNSIPYFGPVVVTGCTAVVAFLQFGRLEPAALIGAAAFAITALEGFLLTPWLTSRAARMNAVAVFIGLIFWGWVWDIWGVLLAVPMLMVVKSICDHVDDFKGVGELLGE